jgi:hypothetical protein
VAVALRSSADRCDSAPRSHVAFWLGDAGRSAAREELSYQEPREACRFIHSCPQQRYWFRYSGVSGGLARRTFGERRADECVALTSANDAERGREVPRSRWCFDSHRGTVQPVSTRRG